MKGIKDIQGCIGNKYGRLTVLKYVGSDSKYRSIVLAKCDCGASREFRLSLLKYGPTTSCGCYNRESVSKSAKTHGLSKTSMYKVWCGIKSRCLNKKHRSYKHYGGRGVTMYHYWVQDFKSFQYWCIKNGWRKGLQIDRIDNDKGYSPDNCRVTTKFINSRNKRSNINITVDGETKVLQDWCLIYGIRHNTVWNRIKRNWPKEKIFIPATHSKKINK